MSKGATSTDEKDEAAKVATAESEGSEAAEETETPEVTEDITEDITEEPGEESGEDFRAKYEAQREHSRTWEARAKANEKKLEKEIQKNQDLTHEVDSLKTEIANKDREVLVAKVSAEEGVRPQFLSGETEEELRDSAKAFLTEYRPVKSNPGGYVGSHGSAGDSAANTVESPAKRAARYKI